MIDHLETVELDTLNKVKSYLVDTCFLIYELEQGREAKLRKFCEDNNAIMISFNIDELAAVEKRLPNFKHIVKRFLSSSGIRKFEVNVTPGNPESERAYADSVSEEILRHVHDPSDAVLVAAAILTKSDIMTRDKHHLFNPNVVNFLASKGVEIHNNI